MAKTYLDIVKYMVEAKFEINGLVEKPDIIGAVFGQTEGLLGDDLDLRELQKGGKIGRIEIDASQSGNKTYGNLYLPASLDKIETCVLAAAVESVDRVGPYEANFQVSKIEDTRAEKRRKLLERAKDLLRKLLTTEIPDSKELTELAVLVTVELIELRDVCTFPRLVFMVTTVPFTLANVALRALSDAITLPAFVIIVATLPLMLDTVAFIALTDAIIVPASVLSVITPLFTLTRVAFIAFSVV